MNKILKICFFLGLSIASYQVVCSCSGFISLNKRNVKEYNKIFLGTIINEQKDTSDKYIAGWAPKEITIKIDELFITDTLIKDTLKLTFRDNGYFKTNEQWLFILKENETSYCSSFWMDSGKSYVKSDEPARKNMEFLRKYKK